MNRIAPALVVMLFGVSSAIGQVKVSVDPTELNAVHEWSAARDAATAAELFEMIEQDPYYSWLADALVREVPEETIPGLAAIAEDPAKPDANRLRALRLLTADVESTTRLLGNAHPGEDLALRLLRSESLDERTAAMQVYTNRSAGRLSAAAGAAVLAMLDDPDAAIRSNAIQICGLHEVEGAAERFIDLLDDATPQDETRLLYWIARTGHQRAVEVIFERAEGDSAPSGLWNLMWNGSDAQQREATARAIDHVMSLDLDALIETNESPAYLTGGSIIRNLAAYGDARCEDLLLRFVESPGYAGDVVLGLARLGSPHAKQAAIELLETDWPQAPEAAVQALGRIARGTGDLDVIDAFRAYGSKVYRPDGTSHIEDRIHRRALGYQIVRESARVGGAEGRAVAGVLITRMDVKPPSDMVWLLKGWTLRTALEHCVEIGILDALPNELLIREVQSNNSGLRSWGHETQDLLNVLKRTGVSVYMHYEADRIPCRHDLMLDRFDGGLLHIESASERWVDPDDHEQGYIVQFISDGRLYRFPVRYFGDSFDIGSCIPALNRALADAGYAERWHPIGLDVEYMLVSPEGMDRFRESFGIQTSTSASNVAAAKAYEDRVKALLGGREVSPRPMHQHDPIQ